VLPRASGDADPHRGSAGSTEPEDQREGAVSL
jgi:hypothetical protein